MAIDTAEKRRSAAGVYIFIGAGVTPFVSKDQEWRQEAGWNYSGILTTAISVEGLLSIDLTILTAGIGLSSLNAEIDFSVKKADINFTGRIE